MPALTKRLTGWRKESTRVSRSIMWWATRTGSPILCSWRRLRNQSLSISIRRGSDPPAVEPQFEDIEYEQRQRCFDSCLGELPIKNRKIILVYYEGVRRTKIERRKKLAEQLQISLDALRIRTHRIRKGLRGMYSRCLQQPEPMRNITR